MSRAGSGWWWGGIRPRVGCRGWRTESSRYFIVSISCRFVGGACLNPCLTTLAILENPADSLDPLAAAICRNGAKVWLRRGRRIGGSRLGARGEKPYRAEKGGHEGGRKRREEELAAWRGDARAMRCRYFLPACSLTSRDKTNQQLPNVYGCSKLKVNLGRAICELEAHEKSMHSCSRPWAG